MLEFFEKRRDYKIIFWEAFAQNPHHRWIMADRYLKSSIGEFFSRLSEKQSKELVKKHELLFLQSSGRYACGLHLQQHAIILIFPNLYKELVALNPMRGHAMLAHELGHILLGHSQKGTEILQAQVEADQFAHDLGYGMEIERFLKEQPHSEEKVIRLTYLTSYHFSKLD